MPDVKLLWPAPELGLEDSNFYSKCRQYCIDAL